MSAGCRAAPAPGLPVSSPDKRSLVSICVPLSADSSSGNSTFAASSAINFSFESIMSKSMSSSRLSFG
jgi:hypothetical protein